MRYVTALLVFVPLSILGLLLCWARGLIFPCAALAMVSPV